MKRLFLLIALIFVNIVVITAQETNGQFRERVFQVDDRFIQHWRIISRDEYFESVDFEVYVDAYAKATAYAEFLSKAYDRIAQIFSSTTSRQTLLSWRERADTMHEFSLDTDEWANSLTDKAILKNDESWAESGFNFETTWRDIYYTKKRFYLWQLETMRASRL